MNVLLENTRNLAASLCSKKKMDGILRIAKREGIAEYYIKNSSTGRFGKYLSRKNLSTIKALAQQDYEQKVVHAANDMALVLEDCIARLQKTQDAEAVYEALPKERQDLVIMKSSDEVFVAKWLKVQRSRVQDEYSHGIHETENGEFVKSKSEALIANRFKALGIPYVYEVSVWLPDKRYRKPDFVVLNRRTRKTYYLEHLGSMGKGEYVKEFMDKLKDYREVGIIPGDNLLLTFESSEHPFTIGQLNEIIDRVLT